jgi:hypothetical protein
VICNAVDSFGNGGMIAVARGEAMRLFIFKSEASPDLRAFGADLVGSRLPVKFKPWRAIGAVAPDREPPHKLSREVIEAAITDRGYQLWRISKKDDE